jgi:hypothetical protein
MINYDMISGDVVFDKELGMFGIVIKRVDKGRIRDTYSVMLGDGRIVDRLDHKLTELRRFENR